jgi:L-iditol 2-dehydrogenase
LKVIRLHASADLHLHEEPDPIPGSGEELINVKAVGICGSDLHWFTEGGIGDVQLKHPLVLGHEFAGISESGTRVAVDPAIPCGDCVLCQNGNPNLCERVIFSGHGSADGALREKMAWAEKSLFPIPDSLTYTDGAMLEPLGVAIHAMDLAHIKPGMTIGVFGCGTIGLLIIQLARLAGAASIIATDKLVHRMEAARALGSSRGIDVAFEVAGEQLAVDVSFAAVVPGGKIILVGIPANNRTTFHASVARSKGLTIKMVRRMKNTYPRAIELVKSGLVDVSSLVTHRYPLKSAVEAFEVAQRREGIKVMIEM